MNKIPNDYYICKDYSTLCGPYNTTLPNERKYMENVIRDMMRGKIDYRITESINGVVIERRGMILPKSK